MERASGPVQHRLGERVIRRFDGVAMSSMKWTQWSGRSNGKLLRVKGRHTRRAVEIRVSSATPVDLVEGVPNAHPYLSFYLAESSFYGLRLQNQVTT